METILQVIGRRLREARRVQGMSLTDVEAISDRAWKASAVGSYERGERSLPIDKFFDLCSFYDIAPERILATGKPSSVSEALSADDRLTEKQKRHITDLMQEFRVLNDSAGRQNWA